MKPQELILTRREPLQMQEDDQDLAEEEVIDNEHARSPLQVPAATKEDEREA